jgi:hypothetical protein
MADKENPDPRLVRITVTDLKTRRDRTKAALAEASEMQSGPPGWRSYSVNDPEGHQWYFTAPDSWPYPAESRAPATTSCHHTRQTHIAGWPSYPDDERARE